MLIKILLIQTLFFVVASCSTTKENIVSVTDGNQGGTFTPSQPSLIVNEIANWTCSKMSLFTNFTGVYMVQDIIKTQMQVTSGINYFLTIQ